MTTTILTAILCVLIPTYPLVGYGLFRFCRWIDRKDRDFTV